MAFKNVFGDVVTTPEGRVSYPKLASPDTDGQFADDKYKTTLLFDKEKADLTSLKAACKAVAKKAWPDKAASDIVWPFRDGDEKDENYQGNFYITIKSKNRPRVVGPDRRKDFPAEDVYGGCYGRASVKPMAYVAGGNAGVTLLLNNFQFLRDGDPFGSKTSPVDDFDDGSSGSADDDLDNMIG